MREKRKQESHRVSFSYLDVFFLLLAGLILSCFVYLATVSRSGDDAKVYRVDLVASYESALAHAIPQEGQALFDRKGEKIGSIESVGVYEAEGENGIETELFFVCYIAQNDLIEGEEFTLETMDCIWETKIVFVKPEEKGEGMK